MECKFVVGQDVVCSEPGAWTCDNDDVDVNSVEHPVFGNVYKVAHIYVSARNGNIYLRLEGFIANYNHRCFRPAPKTDISWAHEILRRVTDKELV